MARRTNVPVPSVVVNRHATIGIVIVAVPVLVPIENAVGYARPDAFKPPVPGRIFGSSSVPSRENVFAPALCSMKNPIFDGVEFQLTICHRDEPVFPVPTVNVLVTVPLCRMLVTVLKSRFDTAGVAVVFPPEITSEIGKPASFVPNRVNVIAVSLPPDASTTRR